MIKALLLRASAIIILLSLTTTECPCQAAGYTQSRIFWDVATQRNVMGGSNPRVIQLQDGRLMAVAAGGGVLVSYSADRGLTWSTATYIIRNSEKGISDYHTPDLIQLSDGTIIVGYNPRPNSSGTLPYSIRCVRSTDNGKTWSPQITIHKGVHADANGCFEPSFLELPSGEVQCYYSNKEETENAWRQKIDVISSYDKGLSWTNRRVASYRAQHADGMPKAIVLNDHSQIVYTIEDNGWRNGFVATTIRCALSDNWKTTVGGNSSNRNIIFEDKTLANDISAAPYLGIFPWGETVASFQGSHGRRSGGYQDLDLFVVTGNDQARNFKGLTEPFKLDTTECANWNSVAVIDTGQVMACGGIFKVRNKAITGGSSVRVIRGYAVKEFLARKGTLRIGHVERGNGLVAAGPEQVVMGALTRQRSTVNFAWDSNNLYLYASVDDASLSESTYRGNNLHLYINTGLQSAGLTSGMYHFTFNAGTKSLQSIQSVQSGKWCSYSPTTAIHCIVTTSISNKNYIVEAAIPWSVLGLSAAPEGKQMAVNLRIDVPRNGKVVTDTIPDALTDHSNTWMTFRLRAGSDVTKVDGVTYELNATGTGYILKKGIASTRLTIPSTVNNLPVVAIADNAFKGLGVKDVTIPASVRSIGASAFNTSGDLVVNFPASGSLLESIRAKAFAASWKKLTLNNFDKLGNLKTIGSSAFHDRYFASITIPTSVTTLADKALSFCPSLKTVVFAEGSKLQTIGAECFRSAPLASINLQACNELKSIGTQAFNYDSDWGSKAMTCPIFFIPASVTTIGANAFAQQTGNVKYVFLTSSPISSLNIGTNHDNNIFYGAKGTAIFRKAAKMTSMPHITTLVDEMTTGGATFTMSDDLASFSDATTYTLTSGKSVSGNYTMPADLGGVPVVGIDASAFAGTGWGTAENQKLTGITIPTSVKSIGAKAFQFCTKLKSVSFAGPMQLQVINEGTFQNCISMTDFDLDHCAQVQTIGGNAFTNTRMQTVNIPAAVTTIGKGAFSWMSPSTGVTVTFEQGSKLKDIGDQAFYNSFISAVNLEECDELTTLGEAVFQLGESHASKSMLTELIIPQNVTTVGKHLAAYQSALKRVTFLTHKNMSDGLSIGGSTVANTWNGKSANLFYQGGNPDIFVRKGLSFCYFDQGTRKAIDDLDSYVALKSNPTINQVSRLTSYSCRRAVTVPDDVIIYKATAADNNTVSLTKVDGKVIPANTGVILYSKATGEKQFTFGGTTTSDFADNKLKAVNFETLAGDNAYALVASEQAFAPVSPELYIPASKAYLTIESSTASKLNITFDGVATGIESLNSTPLKTQNSADAPLYNMAGQRVSSSYRGIVIQKGRKYIKK